MCICNPEFFGRFAVLLLCDISRTDATRAVIAFFKPDRLRFALRRDPPVFGFDVVTALGYYNAVPTLSAPVVFIHACAEVRRVVRVGDNITVSVQVYHVTMISTS